MGAPHEQSVPPRRKRRWRRRFAVAAVVVVAGAVWLNGPGVRWLGRLALGRALPQAGLAGDLRVEGTLLGGLALRDVDLTGGLGSEPGAQRFVGLLFIGFLPAAVLGLMTRRWPDDYGLRAPTAQAERANPLETRTDEELDAIRTARAADLPEPEEEAGE